MSDEAVILVSHGTVDHLDDLGAFVGKVRRGRPAPPELVAELRRRYEAIGGSPLNRINAEVARKLEGRLGVRVATANRLWHPFVAEVMGALSAEGIRRVAMVPLAQHSAHVYAEDARRAAEGTGVEVSSALGWGDRADLCAAFASRIVAALGVSPHPVRTTLVMTAHSLPQSVIDAGDPYERDVRAAAEAIATAVVGRLGRNLHVVVAFQSQGLAGPVAWLGPDLRAALDLAKEQDSAHVLLAPIGFLADHVEVLYDLDIEARAMANERGLSYSRSPSLNADDDFVDVLAEVARPLLRHGHD
jgi:protoporphyrin/coproporphyrin ferrochelatase